jgi:hypothetical protein
MFKSIFETGSDTVVPPTTTTRPVVVVDMNGNLTVLYIA